MLKRLGLKVAGLVFKAKEAGARRRWAMKKGQGAKLYALEAKSIEGKEKTVGDYKGKVLLIVNTASACGFTPQYEGLEALHKKYQGKGLAVLGFPCNDFGAQEPGDEAKIQSFCKARFGVTFDLFAKVTVKGPAKHPVYKYLTEESGFEGDIPWNFAKFVVDRDGDVIARFGPDTEPLDEALTSKVEEALR